MAELPKDMIFHYYSEDGVTIKVDARPVVRCWECKWFKHCEHNETNEPHGFCSWGERREDG